MTLPTQRPHMVVVEDDASIRTFVALALEDLDLELSLCASVGEALVCLRRRAAQVVLTDLMLPEVSGDQLLRRIAEEPGLCPSGRTVVFSAGLTDVSCGTPGVAVWRFLRKPVSVDELRQCVADALDLPGLRAGLARSGASFLPPSREGTAASARVRAIQNHFGGDAEMHDVFLVGCVQQFPEDVRHGDAALDRGDLGQLRVLLHSLKTVLDTLGHTDLRDVARDAEALAASDNAAAWVGWQGLKAQLLSRFPAP